MVKLFGALALATFTVSAQADNPPQECWADRGCIEEKAASHDIGHGAILTFPEGWTYYSYPQAPIPEMKGLREIRAFKGSVTVAITPFPNLDKREITEDWLKETLERATAQYAANSKEGVATVVSMSHDDVRGSYVSYTPKNEGDKPYAVLRNRTFSKVTVFLISERFVIFSVSVASEKPDDDAYAVALAAVRNIQ